MYHLIHSCLYPIHLYLSSQFIQTDLRQVAEKYNNVRFDVVWSKDKFLHPRVTGFYLNGRTQNIVLRNKTSRQVAELVRRLHDRTGGIVNMKRWPSAKTAVPSFQGTWNTAAFQK